MTDDLNLYTLKARLAAFEAEMAAMEIKGGAGSGNWGHGGRPGKRGGSSSRGGGKYGAGAGYSAGGLAGSAAARAAAAVQAQPGAMAPGGGGKSHASPAQIMRQLDDSYTRTGGRRSHLGGKFSAMADQEIVYSAGAPTVKRSAAAALNVVRKAANGEDVYLRASQQEQDLINELAKTPYITDARTGKGRAASAYNMLPLDKRKILDEYGKRAMIYQEVESAVRNVVASYAPPGEKRTSDVNSTMLNLAGKINDFNIRDNQSVMVNLRSLVNDVAATAPQSRPGAMKPSTPQAQPGAALSNKPRYDATMQDVNKLRERGNKMLADAESIQNPAAKQRKLTEARTLLAKAGNKEREAERQLAAAPTTMDYKPARDKTTVQTGKFTGGAAKPTQYAGKMKTKMTIQSAIKKLAGQGYKLGAGNFDIRTKQTTYEVTAPNGQKRTMTPQEIENLALKR